MKKKKKNRAYNNEWVDRFTTALVCMHLICSCMIKKKKKKCIPPDDKHVIFPPCWLALLCNIRSHQSCLFRAALQNSAVKVVAWSEDGGKAGCLSWKRQLPWLFSHIEFAPFVGSFWIRWIKTQETQNRHNRSSRDESSACCLQTDIKISHHF